MELLASLPIPPNLTVLIVGAVAVLLRLSLLVMFLPGLGEFGIPVRIRMGLVLAMTFGVAPLLLPTQLLRAAQTDVLSLLIFESVIGFALGFGFRVFVYAAQIAGTIIAQSASLSQLFGPGLASEPNPSVSMLLLIAGAALFVTVDGHTRAIALIYQSYLVFPLGEVPDLGALAKWATEKSADGFALAVSLSLPFILLSFLYNVVLGLINQAMPQMMVTFIGVPANVLASLVLLAISVGAILIAWLQNVETAFQGFW